MCNENIKQHILQEINKFNLKQQQQQKSLLNKLENYEKEMLTMSEKIVKLENMLKEQLKK